MLAGADIGPITLDDDRDNYIYLQLQISGVVDTTPPAKIITVPVVHAVDVSPPIDAVLLAMVVTDSGDITDVIDLRPSQFNVHTNFLVKATSSGAKLFSAYVALQVPAIGPVTTFNGNLIVDPVTLLTVTWKWYVEVTGPNSVIEQSGTGGSSSGKAIVEEAFINFTDDIGRFRGNVLLFRIAIERLTAVDDVAAGTDGTLTYPTDAPWTGADVFPSGVLGSFGTWAFKEWDAKG